MKPLCADFQGAPAETLFPQQRHRCRRLGGKRHPHDEQQQPASDGEGQRGTKHGAALFGSHGGDIFYRFLPAQIQEQRLLPWKGEELKSVFEICSKYLILFDVTHLAVFFKPCRLWCLVPQDYWRLWGTDRHSHHGSGGLLHRRHIHTGETQWTVQCVYHAKYWKNKELPYLRG